MTAGPPSTGIVSYFPAGTVSWVRNFKTDFLPFFLCRLVHARPIAAGGRFQDRFQWSEWPWSSGATVVVEIANPITRFTTFRHVKRHKELESSICLETSQSDALFSVALRLLGAPGLRRRFFLFLALLSLIPRSLRIFEDLRASWFRLLRRSRADLSVATAPDFLVFVVLAFIRLLVLQFWARILSMEWRTEE